MAILALDLGTLCGWALHSDFGIASGVWALEPGRLNPHRTKWLNLWRRLNELSGAHTIGTVAYEDVKAHGRPARIVGGKRKPSGTNIYAAHLYGSLKLTVEGWAETVNATTAPIAVATIKQVATGKGNAKKEAMLAAAERKWPDQTIRDDNQADALWTLHALMLERGLL